MSPALSYGVPLKETSSPSKCSLHLKVEQRTRLVDGEVMVSHDTWNHHTLQYVRCYEQSCGVLVGEAIVASEEMEQVLQRWQ